MLEVFNEGSAAGAIRYIAGLPKASMIEGDATRLACKRRHLPPPTQMVAAGAVGEDDGWAVSVHLIVEFDSVDLCCWHVHCPRSIVTVW